MQEVSHFSATMIDIVGTLEDIEGLEGLEDLDALGTLDVLGGAGKEIGMEICVYQKKAVLLRLNWRKGICGL